MPENYIPQPDAKFDEWQKNFVKKLSSTWPPPEEGAPAPAAPAALLYEFLGIVEDRYKELIEMQKLWTKDYARGGKEADRRPSEAIAKTETRMEKYEPLIRSVIAEYIRSNRKASKEIKATLLLTVPDSEPSSHPQIVDPIVGLTNKSGGDIELRVRRTTDETQASKPLPHILVQAQYLLTAVGDPAPPFEQAVLHYESSHALSMMHLGITNVGKRFYGYFRWYDPIHPEDSGPWTQVHTIVVA